MLLAALAHLVEGLHHILLLIAEMEMMMMIIIIMEEMIKNNNACKTGRKRKKGRLRMRWMDGWCGEGFEELGCG
jgi:hypothetical protein